MITKKTIFIIPGFRQRPSQKAYQKLAKMLKKEKYHPILMKIPWNATTFAENTEYFLKAYKKIVRKKKYILGFSLGAIIALHASTKVRTSGLILCSLSPFFKEDDSTSPLRCAELAKKIKTKQIHLLYGTRETKSLIRRTTFAFAKIVSKSKRLTPVRKTEHNIGDKNYLYQIHQISRGLH